MFCFLLSLFLHDNFIYYFPAALTEQKLSNFNLFFLHIHTTCLLITPNYPCFIFTSLEIFQVQQLPPHFLSQHCTFYVYFSFQIISKIIHLIPHFTAYNYLWDKPFCYFTFSCQPLNWCQPSSTQLITFKCPQLSCKQILIK